MEELVPPAFGFLIGLLLWRSTAGRLHAALSAMGIAAAALAATVLSGEYLESWFYLLVDATTAALGFGAAVLVTRWMPALAARWSAARSIRHARR
jgi:hypothetical protein